MHSLPNRINGILLHVETFSSVTVMPLQHQRKIAAQCSIESILVRNFDVTLFALSASYVNKNLQALLMAELISLVHH